MPEVAIVTDSLCCLPEDIINKYQIGIVPINIIVKGQIYRDYYDLKPSQAYELFNTDPEAFATSPSSPAQFLEALSRASQIAPNIVCITVSQHLSTVYNVACLAGAEAERVKPGIKVKVIDSETVIAAQGFVVLEAARRAAEEGDFTSIIDTVERMKTKVNFALVLETIKYVYRTGRIPKIAAQAVSVLPVKPILNISNGMVKLIAVSRNMSQGIDHILRTLHRKIKDAPVHIAVMHAYAPGEGEKLRQRMAAEFNCAEIWMTEVSPIVGYALGSGALGFAFYAE